MRIDMKHRFEEFLVIFLILLNVFDFLKILQTDIDFIKKLISWMILGYLVYHISITKQIFGKRQKVMDISIIFAFFLLISKYFVLFSKEITKGSTMHGVYEFILLNSELFTYVLFYIGMMIILSASIYLGVKSKIYNPSFLHIMHGERIRNTLLGKIERIILVFFILIGFFLFLFNPLMEWLGLAIDASLIIVAIIFYTLTAFRRHFKKFKKEDFIFKIGNFGEEFYKEFIELLHTKKGLFLIVSGIICLHILSDIGNFIIPYFFGIKDFIYLKNFDVYHQSLNMILADTIITGNILNILQTIMIYVLNFVGVISLLILPSYIWYKFYKNRKINLKRNTLIIILISILSLVLTPIFHFTPIESNEFIGMDIQSYNDNKDIQKNNVLIGVYFLLGTIIYFITKNKKIKNGLTIILMSIINVFLGLYMYIFFIQNNIHYSTVFFSLFQERLFFISSIMLLFLILNASFYILGFITFSYENIKEISKI